MALGQDAVRRLTVVATETGLTSLNTKLAQNARLNEQVTLTSARMTTATEAADRRMQALLRQRDRYATALNSGGIGGAAGLAGADAGMFAVSRIAPFIAAVGTAYAAIAAVNAVIQRGSQLLEKYANAQRAVDRSDLKGNLDTLSSLQNDTITATQVKYATELGTRLADAKFTIQEFLRLQLDIVDPALKLQSHWVNIVESIAKATSNLNLFSSESSKPGLFATAFRLMPGMSAGSGMFGQRMAPPAEPSVEEQLAAARGRLGAAMGVANIAGGKDTQADRDKAQLGGSFAARFNAAIHDLSNKAKEEAEAVRNAWDRTLDSVSKSIAIQEADAKAVGGTASAHARLRVEAQLTEAAQRSGIEITGKHAEAFRTLGERAEKAADALARAKLSNDLSFERDQIGRSDTEASVASRLRSSGLAVDLDSAEAAAIRMNEQLKLSKDLAMDFASGFARDLRTSVGLMDALTNAASRLQDRLIDMALNKAISGLVGGGLNFGSLFQSQGGNYGAGVGMVPSGPGSGFVVGGNHNGGVAGVSSTFSRFVHPSYFDDAKRYHGGGIVGDEVPVIAKKGEEIGWPAQMAAKYGGKPTINVKVENYGTDVQTRQDDNGDLVVTSRSIVRDEMGSSRTNGINRSKYGLSPRLRPRV